MKLLDKQLEQFFESLKKQKLSHSEVDVICKPLYDQKRREFWIKWLSIMIVGSLFYLLILWSDCVQWFLSAVGRILLIQLLPYWDWTNLYNAKCLIERPDVAQTRSKQLSAPITMEANKVNCLLCEDMDFIPTVSNSSFSSFENLYLERGQPVVITDSHDPIEFDQFFRSVFSADLEYFKSRPCDVSTNIILSDLFDLEVVLRKAWKLMGTTDKWFLQLRNCQFSAVKSSRQFIKRPYYYPVHLEPFYSSWLIISRNYNSRQYQEINVQGLIMVQQLKGSMDIKLLPKYACVDECPVLHIYLEQGEGFVFSTDLWLLSYKFTKGFNVQSSIATVMEINWMSQV